MEEIFTVLPSRGYQNEKFQIKSSQTNQEIALYRSSEQIGKFQTQSELSTVNISNLSAGLYSATTVQNGKTLSANFQIEPATRFGSSTVKNCFLFDDSDFSFVVMQDRLFVYNEKTKILLYENHLSPHEILKINDSLFLFVSKESQSVELQNFAVFDAERFQILGTFNSFQRIKFDDKNKRLWVFCQQRGLFGYDLNFPFQSESHQILKIENVKNIYSDSESYILAETETDIIGIDYLSLNVSPTAKKSNNAVGFNGAIIEKNKSGIIYTDIFEQVEKTILLQDSDFYLKEKDYFYLGTSFKHPEDDAIGKAFELLKPDLPTSHPENASYYYHELKPEKYIDYSKIFYHFVVAGKEIALIREQHDHSVKRITMQKDKDGNWKGKPRMVSNISSSLYLADNPILNIKSTFFTILSNTKDSFYVKNSLGEQFIISGNKIFNIKKGEVFLKFVGKSKTHFIIENSNADKDFAHIVYDLKNPDKPIAENINILNLDNIDFQNGFWFLNHRNNRLIYKNGKVEETDRKWGFSSFVENRIVDSKSHKNTDRFTIRKEIGYHNDTIFDPLSGKEYGQVLGVINSTSTKLSKVITSRDGALYLGKFNSKEKTYAYEKLEIDIEKYSESFLSPDGKYLVLSKEKGNYELLDTATNQKTTFFTGNFLEFTTDGKLIYEEDGSRIARIIDPITLQEITPQNYKYYHFRSPDGTYNAALSTSTEITNRFTGEKIPKSDYSLFGSSMILLKASQKEIAFAKNKDCFEEIGISDASEIKSSDFIRIERFLNIYHSNENINKVPVKKNLDFYNYSAFSFDNQYFAYVGNTNFGSNPSGGIVQIFENNFAFPKNEFNLKGDYMILNASWICGFSKTNYFATYDSNPHTYLLALDELEFISNYSENITSLSSHATENLFFLLKKLETNKNLKSRLIVNKSFLTFSPSGRYMALSEQGYNPISLGGTGHQSSSALHIYDLEKMEIVISFDDHGDEIKYDKRKKIAYAYFSKDEKQVMTLSVDGVVIIRDISIT